MTEGIVTDGVKNNIYTEKEYLETYDRVAAWLRAQDWEGVLKGRAEDSFLEDATEMVLQERADAIAETRIATTPHHHVARYEGVRLMDECGRCGLDLRDPIHYRKESVG